MPYSYHSNWTLLRVRGDTITNSAGTTHVHQDCPGQMLMNVSPSAHFPIILCDRARSLRDLFDPNHHLIHTKHWHLLSSFVHCLRLTPGTSELPEMYPWAMMADQGLPILQMLQGYTDQMVLTKRCFFFDSLSLACTKRCLRNLLFASSTEVPEGILLISSSRVLSDF